MGHSGWAEWRRFSAAMLALMGAFNVVEGLVVMYDRHAVHVDPNRVLLLGPANWARITLLLGGLLLALGLWLCVVTLRVRPVALSVVCAHALSQLGVLTALPTWALLMIAFDVVIIFALTATPAGSAASMARGGAGSTGVGAGRAARIGRVGSVHRMAGVSGGVPAGYVTGGRIGYRPRHEVPAADATLVLGPPLTADGPLSADAIGPDAVAGDMVTGGAAAPLALPRSPRSAADGSPAQPEDGTAEFEDGTAGLEDCSADSDESATASAGAAALDSAAGTAAPQSARPPASATMVGALARASAADAGAARSTTSAAPTTSAAKRSTPPIIGAISGRWPDAGSR